MRVSPHQIRQLVDIYETSAIAVNSIKHALHVQVAELARRQFADLADCVGELHQTQLGSTVPAGPLQQFPTVLSVHAVRISLHLAPQQLELFGRNSVDRAPRGRSSPPGISVA